MAMYCVQALFTDTCGSYWDDVSPTFETRRQAALRRTLLLGDDDLYELPLRVKCCRPKRAPKAKTLIPPKRLIAPAAVVAPPLLRKRAA
jgi:hypothetical protein